MKILFGVLGFIGSLLRTIVQQPMILLVLLVISAVVGGYSYFQYQQAQEELNRLKQNPRALSAEETKKVVDQVGELVELPKGDDPVIATVVDSSKLKSQPFFAKAKNGDKVLIYTQGRRAILYRPSVNKIIDVAPVNIGTSSASTGVAGTQTQKVGVVLYNGTTTAGLTNTVGSRLQSELDNIEIVERANASRDDYEEIIVIDLSGRQKALADQIARLVDGTTGELPDGENKPDADILVILGQEKPSESPTPTPTQQ